jgi:hypothetical protein
VRHPPLPKGERRLEKSPCRLAAGAFHLVENLVGLLRPRADCSLCEHGIAHGVRPVFLVLLDFFRRLFHVTASLIGCVSLYRSVLIPNSGKHMGSYQMPPRRNARIPFSVFSVFLMSAPRLDILCFLSTGRASGCMWGSSSGRSSTSCRSSRSWLSLS